MYRITLTAILAVTVLTATGGVAFGASALTDSTNASVAQYGGGGGIVIPPKTPGQEPVPTKPGVGGPGTTQPVPTAPTAGTPVPAATPAPAPAPVPTQQGEPTPDDTQPGTTPNASPPGEDAAQVPRQLRDTGLVELPFTGLTLLGLMLGGLALLAGGLVVRHNMRSAPEHRTR